MNVKSSLLHGLMKEYKNMQHPKGFVTIPSLFFRLNKSLYGLKQAPIAWYAKIDGFLLSQNFSRCKCDPSVYLNMING